MFDLFKKKTTKVLIVEDNSNISTIILLKEEKKKYSKEVLEIHHEFNTAADNLIIEANKVLDEAKSKDCNKVSRLELLGFKQSSQVTELKPLLQKAILSEEQLKSLSYYQQAYFNNKFINEEQVKIICHKYNLVCGAVSRFKGFVPEKNLKDIEKFELKDKDKGLLIASLNLFLEDAYIGLSRDGYRHIFSKKSTLYAFQSSPSEPTRFYADDNHNIFGLKHLGNINFHLEESSLKICAPVKDMDIKGLDLEDGYKLINKYIPDPVVLQPVKNGYLIVTAWGDESSDELVVNQKMN